MNLSERELIERVRRKYDEQEWLVLHHLCILGGRRIADAMAFNLWRSPKCVIHGFEIKSNRGDWLKELKNPIKAHETSQFCDQWWLVTDKDVAKLEEVPETWGWMLPRGRGLTIVRQPLQRLDITPIDREFMVDVLQAHRNQLMDALELRQREYNAFLRGKRAGKKEQSEEMSRLMRREKGFIQQIEMFRGAGEEASNGE